MDDNDNIYIQGAGGILGKQFQKMRRRLTVTGASSNIDGSIKPGVTPSGDLKKNKGKQDQVSTMLCQIVYRENSLQSRIQIDVTYSITTRPTLLFNVIVALQGELCCYRVSWRL